jgi:hypothetical protein
MSTESEDKEDKPSEWTRVPAVSGGNGGSKVREALQEGAGQVASVIGGGLRRATAALSAPASSELDQLSSGTDLPEIAVEDALAALSVRLDREADFWRALALKAMSRAAWADRTSQFAAIVAVVGCAALAGITGLEAVFGGGSVRALLVLAGATALVLGSAAAALVSSSIRRGQREISREALARADIAEIRLHRVAVVLAIRNDDRGSLPEALKRLEKDTAAPVR